MESRFARVTGRMNRAIDSALSDGVVPYLDRSGVELAQVPVFIDDGIERFDAISNGSGVEHWRTIGVFKANLPKVDHKGCFVIAGERWQIDGLSKDDGQLITFWVRK